MLFIHPRYVFFNKSFRVCLQTTCFIPKSQAPRLMFHPLISYFVPRFPVLLQDFMLFSHISSVVPYLMFPDLHFCPLISCFVCWFCVLSADRMFLLPDVIFLSLGFVFLSPDLTSKVDLKVWQSKQVWMVLSPKLLKSVTMHQSAELDFLNFQNTRVGVRWGGRYWYVSADLLLEMNKLFALLVYLQSVSCIKRRRQFLALFTGWGGAPPAKILGRQNILRF